MLLHRRVLHDLLECRSESSFHTGQVQLVANSVASLHLKDERQFDPRGSHVVLRRAVSMIA